MIPQDRVRIEQLIRDLASAADTLDRNGAKPFQDGDYLAEQLWIAASFKESIARYVDFAGDADGRTNPSGMKNRSTQKFAAKFWRST